MISSVVSESKNSQKASMKRQSLDDLSGVLRNVGCVFTLASNISDILHHDRSCFHL